MTCRLLFSGAKVSHVCCPVPSTWIFVSGQQSSHQQSWHCHVITRNGLEPREPIRILAKRKLTKQTKMTKWQVDMYIKSPDPTIFLPNIFCSKNWKPPLRSGCRPCCATSPTRPSRTWRNALSQWWWSPTPQGTVVRPDLKLLWFQLSNEVNSPFNSLRLSTFYTMKFWCHQLSKNTCALSRAAADCGPTEAFCWNRYQRSSGLSDVWYLRWCWSAGLTSVMFRSFSFRLGWTDLFSRWLWRKLLNPFDWFQVHLAVWFSLYGSRCGCLVVVLTSNHGEHLLCWIFLEVFLPIVSLYLNVSHCSSIFNLQYILLKPEHIFDWFMAFVLGQRKCLVGPFAKFTDISSFKARGSVSTPLARLVRCTC